MYKLSPMLWLSAAALVASSLGCSMCRTDHLCDYAGAGGKWQRGNPTCGRVGSILSDAGATEVGGVAPGGALYGDAWGLTVGGPDDGSQGIESEVIDNGVFEDGQMVSEEVFEGGEAFDNSAEVIPESSSIIIE
ncbi:MAG: hypothetical protein ACTHK7_04995 [Aureliella sp.]